MIRVLLQNEAQPSLRWSCNTGTCIRGTMCARNVSADMGSGKPPELERRFVGKMWPWRTILWAAPNMGRAQTNIVQTGHQ
mmetsp:Transcript_61830/g.102127  ORF Transcript_61830/g.102127 Transcript_61830/m.102127 type:complete len:80 (-) Transcript_61830:519-758(-)